MKKVIYYSLFFFLAVNMCTAIRVNLTSINPLNAELNPICHFLALLGAHHILHVSRIRVNKMSNSLNFIHNNRTTELLLAQSAATEDKDKHIMTLLKNFILFGKNIY